ncbi:hypothetical protein Nekkels1_25 [Cellulophaga phage Nekkels_1]|uniref:Uncharacterized protein n=1 Tax=Cellulophaga phage Nekkels_1 TaxID=2745692 RepID=A0A8E4UXF5_9CAUD|nr:hypothetical protein M1M31_gp25 [Cellulophaga phage Nekkels_1]QQO97025.1 hypothetical protein Nekkels1_25 [Cellulophaga phage Nekkels_1]QQO97118.1 hypothetical protein Nekkels2_25 [Cellulophaga phage Nekkels_2]
MKAMKYITLITKVLKEKTRVMKNKRWTLKISFKESLKWDIIEEYAQLIVCEKDAKELKDSTVRAVLIEDKVTGNVIFI